METKIAKKVLVNLITSLRLLGTIIMLPIYLNYGGQVAALVAALIFSTDFLDGFLARHFHVETFFGSILDGISDKAFAISILSILSTITPLFIISIILEICILLINFISLQNGNNVRSSIVGKIKTFIIDVTLVVGLLLITTNNIQINSLKATLFLYLAIFAIFAQIIATYDYTKKAFGKNNKLNEEQMQIFTEPNISLVKALFDTDYYNKHKKDSIKQLLSNIKN